MITRANYHREYHRVLDYEQLTPGQQEAYDLIEAGAFDYYDTEPEIRTAVDAYFDALNQQRRVQLRDGTSRPIPYGFRCWCCRGTGSRPRVGMPPETCPVCLGNGWNNGPLE